MKRALQVIFILLAAAGCSRPVSTEVYLRAGDCAEAGRYDFVLDMADTLVSYDITFYTRIDSGDGSIHLSLPLAVSATSPSGKLYAEKVWADISAPDAAGHFSGDYILPYRSGVRPSEAGIWNISVSVPADAESISGLGCILKRN